MTDCVQHNVPLDSTRLHAKWHLNSSNCLCRGHECDRQQTYRLRYGKMCRHKRNH